MTHPREDRTQIRAPFVAPVQIRLVGRDLAVVAALDVLREIFSVSDISALTPTTDETVRLYATIARRLPYCGGIK
ncbi:MAG: hypothetical protein HOV79_13350 [Hamadaea sp.]|nr:hypothetical protein [Hamadaea sp.]